MQRDAMTMQNYVGSMFPKTQCTAHYELLSVDYIGSSERVNE